MTSLRRAPKDPEGRMALREHLEELRKRVTRAAIGLLLGAIAGWWLWQDIVYPALQAPLVDFAEANGIQAQINFGALGSALDFQIKGSLWVGVLVSSPVWLYQLWAFITPGLTNKERRYALGFIAAAVPLFLAGAWLAWWVLPNAVKFLIEFTPVGASNIIDATIYLSFAMRIILAFGIAFVLPVVLVGLNFAGLMTGRAVLKQWRITVFLCFVFAAIASPTPDALTLFTLAVPMIALFFAAVGVCLLNDRRRARKSDEPDYGALDDDTASPL
ncbi:twin-arginine translocase subunit TatC [Kineococcus xinjiangensis]|uniref:twin-arginine translocase subunit TatC n=1 Tax=Kineococcus xinjiangensis TaxID=512762 RepID=UPI001FE98B32|nr:twin-arginine translocase subunit TatC [Kineococcus xinjiangensis]